MCNWMLFLFPGLPSVMLTSHKSLFWRHQKNKPATYLATIEAIYYFFVDFHNVTQQQQQKDLERYDGRYDNLLFFFKLKIRPGPS